MGKTQLCFLILIAFLGSSCDFFPEEEIKTEQTKITSIHPKDNCIRIKFFAIDLKVYVRGDTKITKGSKESKFSDLDVGDRVEIYYVSEKTFGLWDYGNIHVAKIIKVLE